MSDNICKHCGGPKDIRNPTGLCDHLYWPDKLSDDAKRANGYHKVIVEKWVSGDEFERERAHRDLDPVGQDSW